MYDPVRVLNCVRTNSLSLSWCDAFSTFPLGYKGTMGLLVTYVEFTGVTMELTPTGQAVLQPAPFLVRMPEGSRGN